MDERRNSDRRFEANRGAPARGRLPHARFAERGGRRGAGSLAAVSQRGHRRCRRTWWLAGHGRSARVCLDMLRSRKSRREEIRLGARPSPLATGSGTPSGRCPMADSGRPGAAGGARRRSQPAERARLRAARHVRPAVRRDSAHRRAHARPRRASSRAGPAAACRALTVPSAPRTIVRAEVVNAFPPPPRAGRFRGAA